MGPLENLFEIDTLGTSIPWGSSSLTGLMLPIGANEDWRARYVGGTDWLRGPALGYLIGCTIRGLVERNFLAERRDNRLFGLNRRGESDD
jgi:hypothetical protein